MITRVFLVSWYQRKKKITLQSTQTLGHTSNSIPPSGGKGRGETFLGVPAMLWSTIIKWGWTWYWKLCRTRWITAYEICVILHIYHSAKAEFNNCFIIHSKYFQALNKPSVLIDFFKTFAWFSAQLENMNSYYFSKRRWHSLSNSFYVSCLLIFFCSVLVIYSAISSFDSCRPAAQLFWQMLKKASVTHRCHGTRLRYTIVSIGADQKRNL